MKKDAFLLGLFIAAGTVVGTKLTEKALEYLPMGINYLRELTSSLKVNKPTGK